jgi:hypothetical protein
MGGISVKDGTKVLEFDKYEIGTILNALKFYKELADDADKDSSLICSLILKIINAPEKKKLWGRLEER